ncbi:MAG TPA: histidine phosphatase family protein [Eubacterium sp.]|nr:histidine phosphatase family protein [Eubacterium sp.]
MRTTFKQNDWLIRRLEFIGNNLADDYKNQEFVIYSSDLPRAKQTAEIVSGYFNSTPVFTAALREFDLGDANGKSKEWARNNRQCPVWQGTIDWAKSVYDKPFIGAESKADVWDRLSKFMTYMLAETDDDIIIVSHDGTLSVLYTLWLGIDIEMLNKCNLSGKTGGVSVLQEDDDGNRIIARLNDMSYMRGALK